MENPNTGRLKDRPYMKDIPYYIVDYCMYSDWGYRKRTRIWTNKKDWIPLTCDGKGTCGNMIEGLHKTNLGNSERLLKAESRLKHIGDVSGVKERTSLDDRYTGLIYWTTLTNPCLITIRRTWQTNEENNLFLVGAIGA